MIILATLKDTTTDLHVFNSWNIDYKWKLHPLKDILSQIYKFLIL